VQASDDLHQVNSELVKAIAERIEIESELVAKINDLSEVYAALSKAQSQTDMVGNLLLLPSQYKNTHLKTKN